MKAKEIADMKTSDLREKLEMESEGLLKLKLHHSVSDIENPQLLRLKRRDVARMKTELHKRETAKLNELKTKA